FDLDLPYNSQPPCSCRTGSTMICRMAGIRHITVGTQIWQLQCSCPLVGSLNLHQISDQFTHFTTNLLICQVFFFSEVLTPDRHIPRAMCLQVVPAVDNTGNLYNWEFLELSACLDLGQVSYL